uniref:Uncharacterized protein n=1 Tax=Quercus lobata TaxID=97700 RepID=A0A7N2MR50_QUELO
MGRSITDGGNVIKQVPKEIERVMVGVEAYLSIRRHASETGLSFFEDDDETENGEKRPGFQNLSLPGIELAG